MIAATFHGPNYWAASNNETTVEMYNDLGQAIDALFDRYDSNGERECSYETLDGVHRSVKFPGVSPDHYFCAYQLDDDITWDTYANEENIDAVLSLIHNGVYDWVVALADDRIVTVER